MSEYTPTTETVRERFADGFPRFRYGQALADFDRWLAAHDAEVRAATLADAATIEDIDYAYTSLNNADPKVFDDPHVRDAYEHLKRLLRRVG